MAQTRWRKATRGIQRIYLMTRSWTTCRTGGLTYSGKTRAANDQPFPPSPKGQQGNYLFLKKIKLYGKGWSNIQISSVCLNSKHLNMLFHVCLYHSTLAYPVNIFNIKSCIHEQKAQHSNYIYFLIVISSTSGCWYV